MIKKYLINIRAAAKQQKMFVKAKYIRWGG